jgi:hypothetical protein
LDGANPRKNYVMAPGPKQTTNTALNRRYYLHQIIKNVGFKYDPHKKTVFVHFNYNNSNRYVNELKRVYNYNVQFEIK